MAGIILNIANALMITASVLYACRKVKKNNGKLGEVFRYFTVLSNVFCVIKYTATCAVTVTMLTVFVFLAPTVGSLAPLIREQDLYLHLICPSVAVATYLLYDGAAMPFSFTLLGTSPVLLYGLFYLYKIMYAPEKERWEDFYTFNRGGKWPISFAAMLLGAFLISAALRAAGMLRGA